MTRTPCIGSTSNACSPNLCAACYSPSRRPYVMRRFEQLLAKSIGLDAASIGSMSIQRAVRLRMRSLGLRRLEDYEAFLEDSSTEWNELVESVVVTETWFFRDAEPFAEIGRASCREKM